MVEILTDEQLKGDSDQQISSFKRKHDLLVAIDTDGAVVDNMNGKQMLIFHPLAMTYWNLWAIESYFREIAEFVNLYSKDRGCNRFIAMQKTFEYMPDRQSVKEALSAAGLPFPDVKSLNDYLEAFKEGKKYGNSTLASYRAEHMGDVELGRLLEWSLAVNDTFQRVSQPINPFEAVPSSLELMAEHADLVVVSQTPYRDLAEYWTAHKIDGNISIICGQEMGSKKDHIRKIMEIAGYSPEQVFMIGDADGDKKAVKGNGGFFFPINPGEENLSWKGLAQAFEAFRTGHYRDIEPGLIAAFDRLLPERPDWEQCGYDHREAYMQRQALRVSLRDQYSPGARLFVMR